MRNGLWSQLCTADRTTYKLSKWPYEYLGINVPSYGLRNENRLPTYHHLDISRKKDRNWKGEWVLVFIIYITGKMQLPLTLGKMQIQEIMRQ
jgi:hypothetical protein